MAPWLSLRLCGAILALLSAQSEAISKHVATTRRGQHAQDTRNGTVPNKVRLEVHYETLCPYCEWFFRTQLVHIWKDKELRERIDLALYPAGNMLVVPMTKVSPGYRFFHPERTSGNFSYVFLCQHGDQECLGNMVQACAMKTLNTTEAYLPLVFCMAERAQYRQSIEKSAYECMTKLNIDAAKVRQCTQTADSNLMMFNIFNQSSHLTPRKQYVPWITVAEKHQPLSLRDKTLVLRKLCAQMQAPVPKACKALKAKASKKSSIFKSLVPWFTEMIADSEEDMAIQTPCYPNATLDMDSL